MADVYSVAQTVSNAGATVATLGDNARKFGGAAPFSGLGTPALQIIEIAAVHNSAAVDFTKGAVGASAPASTGAYTDAGSNMQAAVNAIQGFAEVFIVGVPSATEFCVAINANTGNAGDSNTTTTGYGLMEAAIKAAIKADTSVTVTNLTLTGDDLA